MIGLLQRVSRARVEVDGAPVGEIGAGLCVFVCGEPGDSQASAERLLERLLGYRVFADQAGKMNLSLVEAGGGLLLVPQFTLAADTEKGMRASFSSALAAEPARELFDRLLERARERYRPVAAGRFGAHMQVTLTNDGPVTFWLRVDPARRG
ncbi:MAG: D-tyrosyl-tRNA(Tyr) deacylase [Betaproteobacteria bacterium]|nr:D-tyrosyl-tRNA(Tyr) deacylase [Betaproteobacteria bacterium]